MSEVTDIKSSRQICLPSILKPQSVTIASILTPWPLSFTGLQSTLQRGQSHTVKGRGSMPPAWLQYTKVIPLSAGRKLVSTDCRPLK